MRRFTLLALSCAAIVVAVLSGDISAKPKTSRLMKGQVLFWDSLPADVWQIPDTLRANNRAVMLFEKIRADDLDMIESKSRVTIYHRVYIFSPEGRKWADVTIPLLQPKQKIEAVQARVILPSGDTIGFDPKSIVVKDVVKAKGITIKQHSFSLPGVTDSCIIEYAYAIKLPRNFDQWTVDKEIPLLRGELLWDFYRGKGLSRWAFSILSRYSVPNYITLNMTRPVNAEFLPSPKSAEQIRFSLVDVPPFHEEKYSPPVNSLRNQVRLYYSDMNSAEGFWGTVSNSVKGMLSEFLDDKGKLDSIAKQFDTSLSVQERSAAAYTWVQQHFTNTAFRASDDTMEVDEPDSMTVGQMLKAGSGSPFAINLFYAALLRAMKIEAYDLWVVDRDENFLVDEAKYWQFTRNLVVINPYVPAQMKFYSPGEPYLAPGHIFWVNEGVKGLIGGAEGRLFIDIPASKTSDNRTVRLINLSLNDDMALEGRYYERESGQDAAVTRLGYVQKATGERLSMLSQNIKDGLVGAEVDSLRAESLTVTEAPLVLRASIRIPEAQAEQVGGRMLLKPLQYLAAEANPFTATTRRYPLMFPYAMDSEDQITIAWPRGWTVESTPDRQGIRNRTGDCLVECVISDTSVTVHRIFRLATPFVSKADYPLVQELYQTYARVNDIAVSLVKKGE